MTSSLMWEPVDRSSHDLEPDVKVVLRRRYGEPVSCELDESQIEYLEGLRDGSHPHRCDNIYNGLNNIIKLIKEYGKIRVFETWK